MIEIGQRRLMVAGLAAALGVALVLVASLAGPMAAVMLTAGLFAGGRVLYPRYRQRADEHRRHQDEVRARADEQHRWASRGDLRGVYGTEGAALMRTVSPMPRISPPGDDLVVATVVHTPAELASMLKDKPPAWRYAAFVSILVQRRAVIAARVRDARLGFAGPTGEITGTDIEAGLFFSERLADLSRLIGQIDGFMLSPAFQGVFGDREENADADGIVHAAHRLMDYHDQMLALTERCRGVRVPWSCADLQRDMGLLTSIPVDGFATFIEDFTDRIAESADVARYGTGDVQLDPVMFSVVDDDDLLGRVSARLQHILGTR
jgi:hypothetical protein